MTAANARFLATPDGLEKRRAAVNKRNGEKRDFIIDFFGGKCRRCGMTDSRCLQLDHINGDGAKVRKAMNWDLSCKHRFVRDHPEVARKTLQLLCANCNWIKRVENEEYASTSRRAALAVAG
jgi:hypothetical protein